MKVSVLAVLLLGFIGRCQHLPIPGGEPGARDAGRPAADGGTEPARDAGAELPDAAAMSGDAGRPSDAAVDGGSDPGQSLDAAAVSGDAGQPTDACQGPPDLYADGACQVLQPGLTLYTPRYELWADGATKQRHIYLPEGATIDTSNPDRWSFPVGTRIYKTFSMNGLKLETRVMRKVAATGDQAWLFSAWVWDEDQLHVHEADMNGETNVLGTPHDVPAQAQCRTCHVQTGLDAVNGFGAIQLNHDGSGYNLQNLLDAGRLVNVAGGAPNVSLDAARLPGDGLAQSALGYLHGNCAHCHGGPTPRASLSLAALVGKSSVTQEPAYAASCSCLRRWTKRAAQDGSPIELRIAPGSAAHSGIVARMSRRGAGEQMPPLGTELVDEAGVGVVSAWIDALDPLACQAAAPNCSQLLAAGGAGGSVAPALPGAGSAAP